ncbi:hypothetical protein DXG01_016730 [Tephrocybe rancida]|nr:hypothetical protein DXG01_016730 [Tephrocybe rancida]
MPVTFPVADCLPRRYSSKISQAYSSNPDTLLEGLAKTYTPERILQCSVDGKKDILVRKNGFVLGALLAYNEHHNLVIRINAHAEELRDKFVDHEGKKTLEVITSQPIHRADFGDMAVQMTGQIHLNVKDKSLIPWVLPNFSTTTNNDTVICSAIIMSTLQAYFIYTMRGKCGIPSITLEGTQADWQSILARIDKLPEFGEEPTEWAGMLWVILLRFVRAFDEGGPPLRDKEFWERMIHEQAGSNGYYISGWMSAFCAWSKTGGFFRHKQHQGRERDTVPSWVHGLSFDGVWFPRVGVPPEGYSEVEVIVNDEVQRKTYECTLLAGHVGVSLGDETSMDTVRMAPQWFMYVNGEESGKARKRTGERPLHSNAFPEPGRPSRTTVTND